MLSLADISDICYEKFICHLVFNNLKPEKEVWAPLMINRIASKRTES